MKNKRKQSGLTLMEMMLVISITAVLTVLSIPNMRAYFDSLGSATSTKAVISAALSSARAIAAKNQRYAGIRFQQDLDGNQYMIFIVHEEPKKMGGGLTNAFRAVEGLKPLRLGDSIGVMDLMVRTNETDPAIYDDVEITANELDGNVIFGTETRIDGKNMYVIDTTTFSIIFSPSGNMVIHKVRVKNKDGENFPVNPAESDDDVFNSLINIEMYDTGMFIEDYHADLGLGAEWSRRSFVIYDKNVFNKMDDPDDKYYYLFDELKEIHINPYTGRIISTD